MSTPNVKEAVREKYGQAPLGVKIGESSCRCADLSAEDSNRSCCVYLHGIEPSAFLTPSSN
jgi:hypothetical protein